MTLTTEGLLNQLITFRSEKLALVALVGSMHNSEQESLERLRELQGTLKTQVRELQVKKRIDRTTHEQKILTVGKDVLSLIAEIEPWLATVVEKQGASE